MRLPITGLVLLLSTHSALAQEPPAPFEVAAPAGPQSVLPNMLSTAAGTVIDGRIDYTHFNQDVGDLTLLGFNAHVQHLTPQGFGGYASIPFGYASGDADSESGIGNIEIGGLYAVRQPNMDILLRGGIALDSAGDTASFIVPLTQLSPRLADAYTTGFGTTWGRAQAQLRYASGDLRLGASGGVDLPISGDLADSDAFDGLLNVAVSAGIEQPGFGIGVGFVFLQALGAANSSDDNSISGFNATVDFPIGPTARLFGTFGLPDLDNVADNGADLFAIGAGVRVGLK